MPYPLPLITMLQRAVGFFPQGSRVRDYSGIHRYTYGDLAPGRRRAEAIFPLCRRGPVDTLFVVHGPDPDAGRFPKGGFAMRRRSFSPPSIRRRRARPGCSDVSGPVVRIGVIAELTGDIPRSGRRARRRPSWRRRKSTTRGV